MYLYAYDNYGNFFYYNIPFRFVIIVIFINFIETKTTDKPFLFYFSYNNLLSLILITRIRLLLFTMIQFNKTNRTIRLLLFTMIQFNKTNRTIRLLLFTMIQFNKKNKGIRLLLITMIL